MRTQTDTNRPWREFYPRASRLRYWTIRAEEVWTDLIRDFCWKADILAMRHRETGWHYRRIDRKSWGFLGPLTKAPLVKILCMATWSRIKKIVE